MARWIKISLGILATLVGLLIIIWIGGSLYISRNKKEVLDKVLVTLNNSLNGKAEIASMEPSLLKAFPGISVSLKNVSLKDSLYNQHKHDLLKAQDIDVALNVFSLLFGNTRINKITVNDASIYLYTDSTGYSNTSIFKSKKTKPAKDAESGEAPEIKRINMNNVQLVVDNQQRYKRFDFDIKDLQGKIDYPLSGWEGEIKINTLIKSFAFNTRKGSFLKDKTLQGTIKFSYKDDTKIVTIGQEKLNIGGDIYAIGATINTGIKPAPFSIDIDVNNVQFSHVAGILAPNISSKLLKFKIAEPVNIKGKIIDDGKGAAHSDPYIQVAMTVRNNVVTIPSGELTNCNFDGSFTNKDTSNRPIGDENSLIKFKNLKANYYNAPIVCDSFMVTNLSRPIAAGLVTSVFPLTNLNSSIGGETFNFKGGDANLKLYCKADIDNLQFTKPRLSGNIKITNADITYVPRKIHLINSALNLNFNDKDLKITRGHFQLGKSSLDMDLYVKNFLNLYYTDPEMMIAKLELYSPYLHLGELMPLLSERKQAKRHRKTPGNSVKEISEQLETVIDASQIQMLLKVDRAVYNKFQAKNLMANISLQRDGIHLQKISVNHAGGSLNINGVLKQTGKYNNYSIHGLVNNASVKDFFYAFDNFGQNTITSKNLSGYLSANTDIAGVITENGKLLPKSMKGKVNFSLRAASLKNFKPMEAVQKYAFANRDLSNIQLGNLNGTLLVKGDKVDILPLKVNSSVINFDVQGTYGMTNGTDISMDIPLRNPEKDKGKDSRQKATDRMKGIVLHLRAVDDNKGGVKIKWNKDHGIF
ncbi:AsmA family protein [Pedobacter sp.]|uniref:AsmA family protein n=1 Tax=Pedobacter sp. TaxID=1411316 RepID=UPI003BAA29D7